MPTNTVVGSARAIFTISLVAAATEEVSVAWATKDGTAIAGRDYETNSGMVAFAPGETSKTVEIFVHGRAVETEDRVFYVLLNPPVNALLADEIGACVIHVDTTGSVPVMTVIIPRGEKGLTGDSAYQIALNNGFVGTQVEWLASLRPSPEEIAPLVAPLINAGAMTVTAQDTSPGEHPDTANIANFAGRIAYLGITKKAFAAPLTAGDNVVPVSAFSGDAIDPKFTTGFSISAYRGASLVPLKWKYVSGTDEILIFGALAGDIPVALQRDIGLGDISSAPIKLEEGTKELQLWLSTLRGQIAAINAEQTIQNTHLAAIDAGQVSQDAQISVLTDRLSKVGIYPGQHFVAYNGGQLSLLRQALIDPFMQYFGVLFIGDSQTWGMTAFGIAPIEPRAGLLTDARNNGSSKTWVNLLHKWLGSEYYDSSVTQEDIWPGTPNGVAQFSYTKSVDLFPSASGFSNAGSFGELVAGGSTLGTIWYVNMSVSGSGPHSFSWVMTGKSFDVRFAATPEGAEYLVYVDDVLQGQYKTSSTDLSVPVSFKNSRTHSFTFRKGAKVRIQAVGGNSARDTLRIESIRMNRTIRVTNNGIIGIDCERYRTVILNDSIRPEDLFANIQIGTNNRGMPPALGSPTASSTFGKSLGLMLDAVAAKGVTPILVCANEALNNADLYYGMGEVRAVISGLAASRGIDFIDQYALTKRLVAAGIVYLDDLLHPNDLGQYFMFENWRNALGGSVVQRKEKVPGYYEVTVPWAAGTAQSITHNIGTIPSRVEFEAVMKTGGAGMLAGETAIISMTVQSAASYNAMARKLTTSTVEVVVAAQGLAVLIGGGSDVLSAAQADLKVKVFA